MIPQAQLRPKFAHRINRRIDLAAQPFLNVAQPQNNLVKRRVADDHQIDVALGAVLVRGNGTINERHHDTIFERRKRLAQNGVDARRLQQQSPQLRKHRALAIRLIEDQIAEGFPDDQPRVAELLHFSLHGAVPRPDLANQLAEVEGLIRMPVEKRQDRGPRLAEQASRYGSRTQVCTHCGYNCTHLGFRNQGRLGRRAGSGNASRTSDHISDSAG